MKNLVMIAALAGGLLSGTGADAQKNNPFAVHGFATGTPHAKAVPVALHKKAGPDKPTAELRYAWNGGSMSWQYIYTRTFQYNSQGMVTERLDTDTTTSTVLSKIVDSFDAQGNHVHTLEYINQGSGLVLDDGSRSTNTYDALNRLTAVEGEYLDSVLNWAKEFRGEAAYTGGSRFPSQLTTYEYITGSWVPESRITNIAWRDTSSPFIARELDFDVQMSAMTFQNYSGGSWVDNVRFSETKSGDTTFRLTEQMDAATTSWQPVLREIVYADNQGAKYRITQFNVSGIWLNTNRRIAYPDAQGNDTLINYYQYDFGTSSWELDDADKNDYAYDARTNITERIRYSYDPSSMTFTRTSRSVFRYGIITAIAAGNAPQHELAVFPNPAKEKLAIRLEKAGAVSLQLTDMQGRTVLFRTQTPAGNNLEVSLPQLPQGVYLLQLTQGNEVRRTRLVIGN